MHYKIKILVISRFNYYEIMLINCLLIVYDAYRVNKLIEAKLGLRQLSELGKKTFKTLSLTNLIIKVLDFRVIRRRWQRCLAKKHYFFSLKV